MKEDWRFESIDVSEGFTQIEITEPTYALPPIPSVNFNEFPAMKSTPLINLIEPSPTKSHTSAKLEVAAKIARSFGEPEPDALGYNS